MTLTRTLTILNLHLFRTPYGVRHFGHRVRQDWRVPDTRKACIVTAGALPDTALREYCPRPSIRNMLHRRIKVGRSRRLRILLILLWRLVAIWMEIRTMKRRVLFQQSVEERNLPLSETKEASLERGNYQKEE